MKRWLYLLCIAAILVPAAVSHAQITENSALVITNVVFTYAKDKEFDKGLNGYGLSLIWEQVTWDRKMSIGFGGAYEATQFDRATDQVSYRRMPFYAMFKGLFGSPEYTGYVGAGLGAVISRREITGDEIDERKSGAGFSIAVPVGIYLAPNPKVGFNFNYTLTWSDTDFFDSGIVHAFSIGIVFL
jgi:hypothetical protein